MLQIRKSPQAKAFFRRSCIQVDIPPLELVLWIRTRWGSLYSFLERFLNLKAVCFIRSKLLYMYSPYLIGHQSIHPSLGRKRRCAEFVQPSVLCRLPAESKRLGTPREHQGRVEGELYWASFLLTVLLEFFRSRRPVKRPANVLKCPLPHCLANHSQL